MSLQSQVTLDTVPRYLRANDEPPSGLASAERALFDEFAERGYVVFDLDVPDFDTFSRQLIAELSPSYDAAGRIQDAWRRHEFCYRLAVHQQVLSLLAVLYGRLAFPFQTLNFNKGTQQATHSDTIHFDSTPPGFMAGVWVALEDIDSDNGPLHYFPGSHRLPHLTLKDAGITNFGAEDPYRLYQTVYEPMIARVTMERRLRAEEAHLRRGQALIWAANLLHGGSPIRDKSRSRHSQVTHYYFEGCSYFTPLLSDESRFCRRFPVDIRTNKLMPNYEHGRPLHAPLGQRVKNWAKGRLRRVTLREDSLRNAR